MDLRLVVLDYPKLVLNREVVRKIFSDLTLAKQQNFERASETYVSMGPLDMISTHCLMYDQSELYTPKIVGGIRACWGNRARYHRLRLPIEDYITSAPIEYRKSFERFRAERPTLVDVNAGFADPDYTFAKTGVKITEMLYFALVQFIVRKGFDHWVGATNEKFKASRWAQLTGTSQDGMIFTHPLVQDPHKLLLMETLNYDWLWDCSQRYADVISDRLEILPLEYPNKETVISVAEANRLIDDKHGLLKAAA